MFLLNYMKSVEASYEAFKETCEKNFPNISPRVLEKMIGKKCLAAPLAIVYKSGTDLRRKAEILEKRGVIGVSDTFESGGRLPKDCPDGASIKRYCMITERRLKLLSQDPDILRVDFDPEKYEDENYPKSSY